MEKFEDDDESYLAWLAAHPDGYVINAYRPPTASYLRLHRTTCRTVSGVPSTGQSWTETSFKACGDRRELEDWCRRTVGGAASPCPTCM
jgi:hypothetical protein